MFPGFHRWACFTLISSVLLILCIQIAVIQLGLDIDSCRRRSSLLDQELDDSHSESVTMAPFLIEPEVEAFYPAAEPEPVAPTPVWQGVDNRRVSELLVAAIVQVESAGDPRCIGSAGERGLMQIMEATWFEMTTDMFGAALPFEQAFDPETNKTVGKSYLRKLQAFLHRHNRAWQADKRSLLLACYNAGPERVLRSEFSLEQMPSSVQSYVERAKTLHDYYLSLEVGAYSALNIGSDDRS